jgi:hypothetical protein
MPNPTDYNTYTGLPTTAGDAGTVINPIYPLWMYHPILPAQIVNDSAEQGMLTAADSKWTPVNPNPTT